MSYCRWSCMAFTSDLYVYESDRGFESHVAGRRINVDPPTELLPVRTWERWEKVRKWRASLEVSGEIPDALWLDLSTIGEEAGQSFVDLTPDACADRLEALSRKGFNVPSYAIEALRQEARSGERKQ